MIVDRTIQLALKLAYRVILGWERLLRLSFSGAGVAVWHDGKILVVRHSYRPGCSLPGVLVRRNEGPVLAASRELREEVGITVQTCDLSTAEQKGAAVAV